MIGLIDFSNPIFNYNYKGYTAIINQVIDIAIEHYRIYGNLDLIIDDNQLKKHFNQKNQHISFDYNASNNFLENYFLNNTRHNTHNAHTLADKDDLVLRNEVFNKLLIPNEEITNEISILISKLKIDDSTLGLQIRGTDKISEVPRVPDEIIINSIRKTLTENNLTKIFLSTDDIFYLNLIKNNFSETLIYNEDNLISLDGKPLHFSSQREKSNKDVLLDVYLLSNCKYFLYCYSNVSYLALTIGSQKQKVIKNINDEN